MKANKRLLIGNAILSILTTLTIVSTDSIIDSIKNPKVSISNIEVAKAEEYIPSEESDNDSNITLSDNVLNYTKGIDITSDNFKYLGNYDITGYTPKCVHCCGNNKGITASGTVATRGRTVATYKDIPFGTMLYIKGYGFYKVEDRGAFKQDTIDISCSSHNECYDITSNGKVEVYIVKDDSFIIY